MSRIKTSNEDMLYPKGTKIKCPDCGDHIATLALDIIRYHPLRTSIFEWKNQTLLEGEECRCQLCNALFFDGGRFLNYEFI